VGDRTYGRAAQHLAGQLGLGRPFLHAWSLRFEHPVHGAEICVTEPLPADLAGALDTARALWGGTGPGAGPAAGAEERAGG
jgi:hypothetical protein